MRERERTRRRARALPVPVGLEAVRLAEPWDDIVLLEWPLRPTGLPADRLTSAELAVAELALAGLTNREIGRRRGTSGRTVANQLASVYTKLGVGSRAGLMARLVGIASRTAPPPSVHRS